MFAKIHITLKKDVLDPQGKVVANSLNNLGFETVKEVRQGKYIEVTINEDNQTIAKQKLNEMCEKLLANLVIEDYLVEIE
jgi:phosphoribosylformylglycinamidine synthase